MICIFAIRKNCLKYDAIHDFSVWLRTGSNPTDDNFFFNHIIIDMMLQEMKRKMKIMSIDRKIDGFKKIRRTLQFPGSK